MLLRLPGLPSLPKLRATHFCVYAEPWDTPKLWASLRGPALDLPQAVRRPTQRGPSSSPAALGPRQVSAPQEAQVWPWGCGPSSSRRGALGLQVRRAPGGRPKLFTLQTSGPPLQPRAYQERGEARTDPRAGAGILPSPPPFCSTPPSSFSGLFPSPLSPLLPSSSGSPPRRPRQLLLLPPLLPSRVFSASPALPSSCAALPRCGLVLHHRPRRRGCHSAPRAAQSRSDNPARAGGGGAAGKLLRAGWPRSSVPTCSRLAGGHPAAPGTSSAPEWRGAFSPRGRSAGGGRGTRGAARPCGSPAARRSGCCCWRRWLCR